MTALPIVGRELRVAARRRMSFWGRLIAAAVFVLMAMLALAAAAASGSPPSGKMLFESLATLGFFICAAAGPLLAADILAGERRQGTLGLLFLTDLRPMDVVLGKLAAVSINAAAAVLASLPVMAVCLLMGGVTLDQLGALALVLFNTLFFSLVCAVLVSAFCTESRSALSLSACVVAFFILVVPNLRAVYPGGVLEALGFGLGFISPATALHLLRSVGGSAPVLLAPGFLLLIAWVQLAGWLALGATAWVIKRAWREQLALSVPLQLWQRLMGWVYGGADGRKRLRQGLLERNPWTWLGSRNVLKRRILWGVVIPILPLWIVAGWFQRNGWDPALTLSMAYIVQLLLKVLIASEACHLFGENRRSGAFELLLTTPLDAGEITRGHLATMRRLFLPPALVTAVTAVASVAGKLQPDELLVLLAVTAMMLWDMHTLAWVGMWRGLRQRRPHLASVSALTRVLFWPGFLLVFLGGMAAAAGPLGPLVMAVVVYASSNLLQASAAADLLATQMRRIVAEQFQSDRAEGG
ncbi:MAG: ABC transporter permease subunit [Verrucomicrobiales bacterium]|nr:ABC transporter permease subunit [Verrucomicrobiales bacterium]